MLWLTAIEGIVPGFWRPIVGIDAFDLREHEIDVTPWLPLLCDGSPHTFEIRVAGLSDDGAGNAVLTESVGSYWIVTGKIFIFSDAPGSITTGTQPQISESPPQFTISSSSTQNATGANETLMANTAASRSISITSTVTTSNGSSSASWTQQLSYSNFNSLTSQGLVQLTIQNTTGADASSSTYANTYSYPIDVNSSYYESPSGDLGINGTITRGLDFNVFGPSVFPSGIQTFNVTTPSTFGLSGQTVPQSIRISSSLPVFSGALLSTTQTSSAEYYSAPNGSYSFGTTEQDFTFDGVESNSPSSTYELYTRSVKAVNTSIVFDQQTLAGQTFGLPATSANGIGATFPAFDGFSVKSLLGRGPGKTKAELGGGPS